MKAISNKDKTEQAHERREKFVWLHSLSKTAELKLIYSMYLHKDWLLLGFDDAKSFFTAPIESGGLDISREWAYQLYAVYQKFVIELGIAEQQIIDAKPRKLYEIADVVNKENIDEWLNKAKILSLQDLRLEKMGIDTQNCEHEDEKFVRCKKCKRWAKSCYIKN